MAIRLMSIRLRRRPSWRRILPVLLMILLSACSSVIVRHDHADQFSVAELHSYGWRSSADKPAPLGLQMQRIRSAVEQALSARDLQPSDNPDVLIEASYRVEDRQEFRQYPQFSLWRHQPFEHEIVVHHYKVGILTLRMINPDTDRVLWEAETTQREDQFMTPEERNRDVQRGINAMFEHPPWVSGD